MGKKKKNTSQPKNTPGCPEECNKVTLKMDCNNHPQGLPMPARRRPNGWKVNTHSRCNVDRTEKLIELFESEYEKGLKCAAQTYAQSLGIDANDGEELVEKMKDAGLEPQMHHILPVMFGGEDIGENLIPLAKSDHLKAYNGVHSWWDRKFRDMGRDLEKKLGKCKDKPGRTKKERALAKAARVKSGNMRSTCDTQLTVLSRKLSEVRPPATGVKLYVDCKTKRRKYVNRNIGIS